MNEDQDNTNDPMRAIGMSAAERDVRNALARIPTQPDDQSFHATTGVMRKLMKDLDMWREISTNDMDDWSFDGLMAMAKRLLAEVYPKDIFLPKVYKLGDEGDLSRVFFVTVQDHNDGPVFVSLLREVIKEIEKRDSKPQQRVEPQDRISEHD